MQKLGRMLSRINCEIFLQEKDVCLVLIQLVHMNERYTVLLVQPLHCYSLSQIIRLVLFSIMYTQSCFFCKPMDDLHYRLISDPAKSKPKNEIPRKNLSKVVKFQNLVVKYCKILKIQPCEVCKFSYCCRNCYHF